MSALADSSTVLMLLWSWWVWRACSCFSASSCWRAVGIWDNLLSTSAISWFTYSSSLMRRSRLISKSLLDCSMSTLDWVKEAIFPRVVSTRSFKSSLCLIICSWWSRSERCFWALRTEIWWLSMKASWCSASSRDSGRVLFRDFRIMQISLASWTSWSISWFSNCRISWSLALVSSDSGADFADDTASSSAPVVPSWKENRLLSGLSCAWLREEEMLIRCSLSEFLKKWNILLEFEELHQ